MSSDRRHVLKLLPAAGISVLAGCNESDDERNARLERMANDASFTLKQSAGSRSIAEAEDKAKPSPEEIAANDKTKKLVLFLAEDLSVPFQRVQADLMRSAMGTLVGYRFKTLDAAGGLDKQIEQLRQVDSDRPEWLIIQPVSESLVGSLIEPLRRDGVHIAGLDQHLAESSCDVRLFLDERQVGRIAGQLVVDALRRKAKDEHQQQVTGRVIQIQGKDGSATAKARSEGFAEALHAEPGIILVHDAAGAWTRESGRELTKEALRLQHQFDVVFAHNDAMAQGASEALTSAQQRDRVLVVGIDGVRGHLGGIDLLRRSIIDATIWLPMPMEQVFQIIRKPVVPGVSLMADVKPLPAPVAVTPVNLDDFVRATGGGKAR